MNNKGCKREALKKLEDLVVNCAVEFGWDPEIGDIIEDWRIAVEEYVDIEDVKELIRNDSVPYLGKPIDHLMEDLRHVLYNRARHYLCGIHDHMKDDSEVKMRVTLEGVENLQRKNREYQRGIQSRKDKIDKVLR